MASNSRDKELHLNIIQYVKEHPILYDTSHPEYRDSYTRLKLFAELGESLNMSGNAVKSKWRNLRDTYSKYLKGNRYDKKGYCYNWHWAPHMEFLREHLMGTANDASGDVANEVAETETYVEQNLQDETSRPMPELVISQRRRKTKPIEKEFRVVNRTANNLSSTEHIMMGYAKVIDGFSPKRRISTKIKIAQLMMEAEMEEESERMLGQNPLHCEFEPQPEMNHALIKIENDSS